VIAEQRQEAEHRVLERVPPLRPGPEGNERFTATIAVVLLVLLALEGATILLLRPLISVHVFVGMLLVPPIALKLVSTGWRFFRYYVGDEPYVMRGPPAPLLRFVVAPVVVLSTLLLFGSGIALIALGPGHPLVVGLHKAAFVVWFGSMAVHVLAYALRLPRLVGADLRRRTRGRGAAIRAWALAGSLVAGTTLAVWTLPLAHTWHTWLGVDH
jgi:hypothetical protein